jgi:hypothetical protein
MFKISMLLTVTLAFMASNHVAYGQEKPTEPPTVPPTIPPTIPPTVPPTVPPTIAPTHNLPPTEIPPAVAPTPPPTDKTASVPGGDDEPYGQNFGPDNEFGPEKNSNVSSGNSSNVSTGNSSDVVTYSFSITLPAGVCDFLEAEKAKANVTAADIKAAVDNAAVQILGEGNGANLDEVTMLCAGVNIAASRRRRSGDTLTVAFVPGYDASALVEAVKAKVEAGGLSFTLTVGGVTSGSFMIDADAFTDLSSGVATTPVAAPVAAPTPGATANTPVGSAYKSGPAVATTLALAFAALAAALL